MQHRVIRGAIETRHQLPLFTEAIEYARSFTVGARRIQKTLSHMGKPTHSYCFVDVGQAVVCLKRETRRERIVRLHKQRRVS